MRRFHTEEHVVADLKSGKVVSPRSVKKLPQEIKGDELRRVIGRPWAPSGFIEEKLGIKRALIPKEEEIPERLKNAPTAVKFTNSILEEFGFSEDCPSCLAKATGTIYT